LRGRPGVPNENFTNILEEIQSRSGNRVQGEVAGRLCPAFLLPIAHDGGAVYQEDENQVARDLRARAGRIPHGTAARRSAATWNIPDRLRMLFSRERIESLEKGPLGYFFCLPLLFAPANN
jgi:hypothetical protein